MFLGQVIGGQYRIERQIGEGGFGTIYLARHLSLDRDVAIKSLRLQRSPYLPDLVQRFEREVSLARKLEHPNIVRLYDHGRLDDGTLFMVMEYVRGVELEDVLREEFRICVDRATRIVVQILDALAEAHELGIVHRDLKPSNVMLTRSGLRSDVVKLLDFGIAKAFDGTYEDLTAQNLSQGVGFGTPQYMAPEQINAQHIGPHTDIYATGLIYLELMLGMPVMLGQHPADTIRRQLEEEVPISEFIRRMPMGPILMRALEKDWRRRYQTAAEMFADIERDVLPLLTTELAGFMIPEDALEQPPPVAAQAPVASAGGDTFPSMDAFAVEAPPQPSAERAALTGSVELNESRPPASESGPTVIVSDPKLDDALAYAQQQGWVPSQQPAQDGWQGQSSNSVERLETFIDRPVPLTVNRRAIEQETMPTHPSMPMAPHLPQQYPAPMSQPFVPMAAPAPAPVVPPIAYVLGGFAMMLLIVLVVLLLTL